MVLARGTVPCDVLFVGEAPGVSEDVVGKPFVGPAGKLLDRIIDQSGLANHCTYALTNLICCIPREDGSKAGEPSEESILSCRQRLIEFVYLCHPKLIICVGSLAVKHVPIAVGPNLGYISIVHPAAILRANVAQQGFLIQKCVVTLADAAEGLR